MMGMQDPLELEVRKKIYETICTYPGIHLRELQRKTTLATGSLDYHLHFLQKNNMIRVEKGNRFSRYYSTEQQFSSTDRQLLSLLRQEPVRHILVHLLNARVATATKLAEACKMQPSSLSQYLRMLETAGVVTHVRKGRYRFYAIKEKEAVVRLMAAHKKSFVDTLVDNFIDIWAEDN